jgi:DNA modification methylase
MDNDSYAPSCEVESFMKTNTVYTGEAAEVLKSFPDECIDLTVTSPPYDNLRTYKGFTFDFEAIAKELYRVTKSGGVVVWVVGDATVNGSETGTSFTQALYFKSLGFNLHDTMIYEKNGSALPDEVRYFQCFEYMFIFSKGKPKSINLIEDRKNRFPERWGKGRTVREKDGSMTERGEYHGKEIGRRFNIWRVNGGYGYSASDDYAYKHPAIFPEALARDHILSWSNKGDVVLDPMCGNGTTLKMAKQFEREYIGIELSPEYVKNIIEPRLRASNVPLPMGGA